MNELQRLSPQANFDTLKTITSFGYAIQSSDDTPMTKVLPDFPCDSLKLLAQISEANPSATPYQLIYRLYPFESFLPKESYGSLTSLFDALEIETPKPEKTTTWMQNIGMQKNQEQKIISVERPTLSKSLLESGDPPHHKGKSFSLNSIFFFFFFF